MYQLSVTYDPQAHYTAEKMRELITPHIPALCSFTRLSQARRGVWGLDFTNYNPIRRMIPILLIPSDAVKKPLVPLHGAAFKRAYQLLFQTAARLLLEYGQKYLKGKIGFTILLHTWGQLMQFHPHVHCMVTGGALLKSKKGGKWQAAQKKWLFPVVELSADFRRAFCQGVRELAQQGKLVWDAAAKGQTIEEMVTAALSQDWEVHIEAPPQGVRQS